ncbi:restriction endonuclease subunit S [Flavobacterium oreochromis]|uniref:Type I restriction modification DNA specificity domain-containing protein n=1 Tax=Flavobacterium columnare TaxID=996 RepID=A0A246GC51_9FLAO|nr:restriction endonuclease subunit S [Flavobacterium oreochromis]OWP78452.1 hypothetical protein BWK62_05260 [Flavobacterium oreochromis]
MKKIAVKYLFNIFSGSTPESGQAFFWDGENNWFTPDDLGKIGNNIYIDESKRKVTEEGIENANLRFSNPFSIIITKRAPIGNLAIVTKTSSCNQGCFLLEQKSNFINIKFYYYFFLIQKNELNALGRGSTFLELNADEMRGYKIPLPSLEQQHKIVDYLDREIAKIDALIEKKTRLIELLDEKKKAVINQAVTKGLNPKVAMKDSGIEWLGEIPVHWNIERLKFLTNKVGSGVTPLGGANIYTDEGILFLRSQNIYNDGLKLIDETYIPEEIHNEMKSSQVMKGDLLLNITGGSIGRCFYYDLDIEANINQHVCIIRVNDKILYRYLHFLFISIVGQYQIDLLQYGGGREAISFENIKNFVITFPKSIEEQKIIINFLDTECSRFDKIKDKVKSAIDLLKEKRTTIISAAINSEINLD